MHHSKVITIMGQRSRNEFKVSVMWLEEFIDRIPTQGEVIPLFAIVEEEWEGEYVSCTLVE